MVHVTELCLISRTPSSRIIRLLFCSAYVTLAFQFYVLVCREGLNTLRAVCVLAYVIGTVSLTLEGRCLEKTAVQSTGRPISRVRSKFTGHTTCDVRQSYCAALPMARNDCVITCKVYILKSGAQVVRCSPWQQNHSLDKSLDIHGLFFLREMYCPVTGFVTGTISTNLRGRIW